MADINITDDIGLSGDLQIRDDSPLAKAGLTKLVTTAKKLFDDFDKPVDEADFSSISLAGNLTSPQLLSSEIPTTFGVGVNSSLSVAKAADKLLFADDGFSPIIPIVANQAWAGAEFDVTLSADAKATAYGVGVGVEGTAKAAATTYSLITVPSGPLPLLRDACGTAFSNFSLTCSAAGIRKQLTGTVNEVEVSGSIAATVSFEAPINLNALASANLPFNKTMSVQPGVTLKLAGSVKIEGDFLVRSYKKSAGIVCLGVYKKRGTTFSARFTAGAGIAGKIGEDDLLSSLLDAALPGVDVAAAGITGDNAKALNGAIKAGLDRSLAAQLNVECSAAHTNEAAVVYEIQLDAGVVADTDAALDCALRGDWNGLGQLPNQRKIRDIAVRTGEKKFSLTLNLFGFYSAISVKDYLRSCTILVDEGGQLSVIDKLDVSRISASTTPYAVDKEKLRRALLTDFLCTATYAIVAQKLDLTLAVSQSYFDYKRQMPWDEMNENVLLGYALDVIPGGSMKAVLDSTPWFAHASVEAIVKYDNAALLSLFYSDAPSRKSHTQDEVDSVGRAVMCQLLDPDDPTDAVRISVLQNDAAWGAMREDGNSANFKYIPYLSHLGTTQLGAVSADYYSIVWWTRSLLKIAPVLSATLEAVAAAAGPDPTQDKAFMKRRDQLAHVLGDIARKTDAAFVPGWGEAVMFALGGRQGKVSMDVQWDGNKLHFGVPVA